MIFSFFFKKKEEKYLTKNVWSRFFIYSLVLVKLALKQSKYIEICIFYIKIIQNFNILRTLNYKPNLKKDLNSLSKNKQEKVD